MSEITQNDADMAQLALNLTRNKFNPNRWAEIDRWLAILLRRATFREKHTDSELECSLIECRYDLLQATQASATTQRDLETANLRCASLKAECDWMRRNAPLAYSQYKLISSPPSEGDKGGGA